MGYDILDVLYGLAAGVAGRLLPTWAVEQSKFAFNRTPNMIPDLNQAVKAAYKGSITYEEYIDYARQNGFDKEIAESLYKSERSILSAGDAITAWRRGIYDETELSNALQQNGFTLEDIETVKDISEFFPSPSDLVTFAIREVYSQEVRQRFQLDADLPDEFLKEAFKAGLGQTQARNYWAAHWQLPSATQGFEMLHRGVIDMDDLSLLLKALDVMPFWREKLTQISYNPLTRVDVRRMYEVGVLDEDGVLRAYKDVGYNDLHAEQMTDYTVRYVNRDKTALSRTTIIDAYKKAIISADDTADFLFEIGYDDGEIALIMAAADYEITHKEIDDRINEYVNLYKKGSISLDELKRQLRSMDLPSSYTDKIIGDIETNLSSKLRMPTKSDLERWLKMQIINDAEYTEYMTHLGYRKSDILLFLQEISLDVDTSAKKYQSINVYKRWLKLDIMHVSEFRSIAEEMKINKRDIERYIKEVKG